MYLLQKNKFFIFTLLFLLLLPAVFSLIHAGFFLSDDGNWMVVRFSAFYEALRSGQFPVRFLSRLNFGYGYPVADFLYPLFMYVGVSIHAIGINFVTTIKVIFGLSIFLSGFATFFWLKKIMKSGSAFIGSLIYVYFPYHIYDVYQRGSIGEVLALAIVPLILWLAERKRTVYVSLGLAGLILAHNSLAVLFLPCIFGYFLVRKLFSIQQLSQIILFTLGLSAFFWIPALYDKQFTNFDTIQVSSLQSYFLSSSTYSLVGWATVVILLVALMFLFIRKNASFIYFFVLSIFSIFMALPFSEFIWQATRIAPYFQFPYRFLSLTILGASFVGAAITEMIPKKYNAFFIVFLVIIVYFSTWNFLTPQSFQYYPDSFYSTNQDSTTVKNEYMPKWVKIFPLKQSNEKITADDPSALITVGQNRGSKIEFQIVAQKSTVITVNTIDFPGWKVVMDGKSIPVSHDNPRGLLTVTVPKGTHTVSVVFSETPIRFFADFVSILSLIIIIFLILKRKHEQ